ncbi:MAG: tRNA (adenosine(37)-N6)-threonylcarbamoyltransferase complex ATPase subunit type 1 TsaE [Acidobacteria bacterium]|nr:tRNA (adenosine(37)-N6)-threonylcarbamoyltransferase complex ATPase subunit type 1 TsaE [Acidobacteriota bacterium]
MTVLRTTSVEETRQMAGAIATLARPGDVILLVGDLGAGKTAFAQGFARAIGVEEQVTSPTFTLVRSYKGKMVLHHLDVYRLEWLHEAEDLGLAELVDDGGVVLIEWGDAVTRVLPNSFLELRFTFVEDDDDHRAIAVRVVGPSWANRAVALATATQKWSAS